MRDIDSYNINDFSKFIVIFLIKFYIYFFSYIKNFFIFFLNLFKKKILSVICRANILFEI